MFAVSKTSLALLAAAVAACGPVRPATAQIVYKGNDPGVGPGVSRPNSDAAAASFRVAAGALGPAHAIDFESAPVGFVTSLGLDANTTLTTSSQDSFTSGISASPDVTLGYDTTAGGGNYFEFAQIGDAPSSVTFTFAAPVVAFGSYLTGTELGVGEPIDMLFNDGKAEALTVPKNPAGGGVQFFGFTDAGKAISSVTFAEYGSVDDSSFDRFGIDDLIYVASASAVPEASNRAILGLGLLALVGLFLCVRKSRVFPRA